VSVAQIIHVPADQPTIQAGINAATDGDTVLVADGTYLENINFMGKAILVASLFVTCGDTNHINNTIIDGSQPANRDAASVVTFNSGEDTTSILAGFTITGGVGTYVQEMDATVGGGVLCRDAGARISYNDIVGNYVNGDYKAGGGGIASLKSSDDHWIVIENNSISDNYANSSGFSGFGGGIYSNNCSIIRNNIIQDNHCDNPGATAANGGGVLLEKLTGSDSIRAYIINNKIRYNSIEGDYAEGAGIESIKVIVEILDNEISYNSGTGAYQAFGGGILTHMTPGAVKIINNEISYNSLTANDIPVGGGIVAQFGYDSYLIENNYIHHNECFGASGHGAGILVNGNYCETTIQNNDVSFNTGSGTNSSTGFIRIITPHEQVNILNNVFSENLVTTATYCYGGIFVWDAFYQRIVVDGNLFLNNHSDKYDGAFYARNSNNLSLTNNLFKGNTANNNGGAVVLVQYYEDDYSDSYMKQGEPLQKPAASQMEHSGRSDTIRTCIANNTFIQNQAGFYGGALMINLYDSLLPVTMNNIFWENEAGVNGNDIHNDGTDGVIIFNSRIDTSAISGKWTGFGNIAENPGFTDDSCHIDEFSPCEDTGIDSLLVDGTWYKAPMNDMEGTPRPWHLGFDMGADECDIIEGVREVFPWNAHEIILKSYPNPTSGISHCAFRISQCQRITLKIYDLHGREVALMLDEMLPAGEHIVRFDVSGLPAGIYLLKLMWNCEPGTANCEPGTVTKKVVVQ
jgi:hypothetical protein